MDIIRTLNVLKVNIFSNKTSDWNFQIHQKCGQMTDSSGQISSLWSWENASQKEVGASLGQVVHLKYLLLDFKATSAV